DRLVRRHRRGLEARVDREQPLEIETSGEFEGFYQFLQSLERLPRVTRVPNMELKRDSRNDGELDVKFTLSIYFQDEAAAKKSEAKSEEAKS
ncbi:MAG: type 4a pilus biogenesis protein PilO, partial [Planctomycetota bacterium]